MEDRERKKDGEKKSGEGKREDPHTHTHACGRRDIYARSTNQAPQIVAASSAARATINSPLLLSAPLLPVPHCVHNPLLPPPPPLFCRPALRFGTSYRFSLFLFLSLLPRLGLYLYVFCFIGPLQCPFCVVREEGPRVGPSRKSAALIRAPASCGLAAVRLKKAQHRRNVEAIISGARRLFAPTVGVGDLYRTCREELL